MSSEKSSMEAPITQEIEGRLKDLSVEEKSQETTNLKADGAPAHMEDEKKESDVEDKSEAKIETEKVEEKKENEKDVEVDVACVDHRTYAGDEGKTEEVPVTVVHEIHGKKESPPSGMLNTVGTKVLSTATGIKNTIVGKSNTSK
jgi:hypothetical protein